MLVICCVFNADVILLLLRATYVQKLHLCFPSLV
uniref:Uncharacterized protein n=1 Tax=Arundo donax TaxID=35708 RepID=A0A0A9BMW6_ARUDO